MDEDDSKAEKEDIELEKERQADREACLREMNPLNWNWMKNVLPPTTNISTSLVSPTKKDEVNEINEMNEMSEINE